MFIGTTFVIDAALINNCIVQVILETGKFNEFSLYSKGMHIKKYLAKNGAKKYFGNPEEFSAFFLNIDESYALNLKDWLLDS